MEYPPIHELFRDLPTETILVALDPRAEHVMRVALTVAKTVLHNPPPDVLPETFTNAAAIATRAGAALALLDDARDVEHPEHGRCRGFDANIGDLATLYSCCKVMAQMWPVIRLLLRGDDVVDTSDVTPAELLYSAHAMLAALEALKASTRGELPFSTIGAN